MTINVFGWFKYPISMKLIYFYTHSIVLYVYRDVEHVIVLNIDLIYS
jgi:hypothetical protein